MATLVALLLINLASMAFTMPLFVNSAQPSSDQWIQAEATAFGDSSGTINGGACGYGGYNSGYGTNTVAISSALLSGGAGCGTCFEIKCDDIASKACAAGGPSVLVTVTNFCPSGGNGWCSPPHKHFSVSETAFNQIATSTGAPVPVLYRRATCQREGGIQFTINGGSNYNVILITNVGGKGQVKAVSIKGSQQPNTWIPLTHLWGSNWKTPHDMRGQSLSFQVVLIDGTIITSNNVTSSSWQLGQTFLGNQAP